MQKFNFEWYWKRLKVMSFHEIWNRIYKTVYHRIWKFKWKKGIEGNKVYCDFRQKKGFSYSLPRQMDIKNEDLKNIIQEADSYLNNEWFHFNMLSVKEDSINWHYDPVSGKTAPLKFAFDINHRDVEMVGNIKVIWEKNRHHHLTVLSLAYYLTKEEKYAQKVAEQLLDWIKKNPVLTGVNWSHPLEYAIRLISWVWCERLLEGSSYCEQLFGAKSSVWESIYFHQKFIAETYSIGTSANNHLIGEMAGLYLTSIIWPFFEESASWENVSKNILEREIEVQTFPSGINREQAFSYQIFVIEFFLLAAVEAKHLAKSFSSRYYKTLKKMIEVIPLMTDVRNNLPRYGDSDEGMAVQLQSISARRDTWIYEVSKSLLDADVPVYEAGTLPARLLEEGVYNKHNYDLPKVSHAFEDAGIFILTQSRNAKDEVFVMADAGPLGFLSIAAHGHADALSFTMSVGGVPLIVDPGTYCYHTEKKWRYYFRSTKAHNTITIDNLDQSIQIGPFLWSSQAHIEVGEWEPANNILRAFHNGYLCVGVLHERKFELRERSLTLFDRLEGTGMHIIESRFHFDPKCEVRVDHHRCFVENQNVKLEIDVDKHLVPCLIKGQEQGGWFSRGFGIKEPTYTLVMKGELELPFKAKTKIIIETDRRWK